MILIFLLAFISKHLEILNWVNEITMSQSFIAKTDRMSLQNKNLRRKKFWISWNEKNEVNEKSGAMTNRESYWLKKASENWKAAVLEYYKW